MALLETNPIQLQHASGNATPLFLIHDGGGTILKYFLLGSLDRNVYGIYDPKFDREDGWEGGIVEMAQEYITFIKAIKGTGPILLGGQYGRINTFHRGLLAHVAYFKTFVKRLVVRRPCISPDCAAVG